MSPRRIRLAALASHPIQYQAPLFRRLAGEPGIDLEVLFCSKAGFESHRDQGFGVTVEWDVPLLDGYAHRFIENFSPRPNPSSSLGLINPQVYSAIRNSRFDVLWVHGWFLLSNWFGFASAWSSRIPVLLRGEASGLVEPAGCKGMLKRAILGSLFRKTGAMLAVGTNNAEFYKTYGVPQNKIFAAPYTVDNDWFKTKAEVLVPQKKRLRREAGLPEDQPLILFCGKLLPAKRPLDLLAAFATLPPELGANLIFVGDGALRPVLEAYTRERRLAGVHFAGFRNQSELPNYYAMADVLVLPSGFEPWGLVVNEAMCFGLPVIVSDMVGCSADLVRAGENGDIFAAGNVQALRNSLVRVLSGDDAQAFGNKSLALISKWGFSETVSGILEAIQSVTDTRPA